MSMLSLATALLACCALAAAAPADKVPSMDLELVLSKSVCPIEVDYDEDEDRIPRRIKVLRCGNAPNPICRSENMTHACCRAHHHSFSTQCVNVLDHVLVRYTNRGDDHKLHKHPVLVGCTCMIREDSKAIEDR